MEELLESVESPEDENKRDKTGKYSNKTAEDLSDTLRSLDTNLCIRPQKEPDIMKYGAEVLDEQVVRFYVDDLPALGRLRCQSCNNLVRFSTFRNTEKK